MALQISADGKVDATSVSFFVAPLEFQVAKLQDILVLRNRLLHVERAILFSALEKVHNESFSWE